MHPNLIAAACKGTWQQKWDCGWHQPTTGAANAGAFAGHNVAPVLIGLLVVFAVFALLRRRSGTPAASKG